MKEIISTGHAPSAIGPYSQAVKAGGYLFISGQLPIDPGTGSFAGNAIETQTKQVLDNLKAILGAAGMELSDVVRVDVFMADLDSFAAMNAVYAEYFPPPFPARAAVEVSRLPKDALIEISAIAYKEGDNL